MKRYFFYCIASVLVFTSCKPAYVRQGVKQIDDLMLSVYEIDNKLNTLDTTALTLKYREYLETISFFKTLDDDAYTPEEWSVMTQYGQIRKPLRNFIQQMPGFYKESAYSKSQLENLKYDLRKKHIHRDLFEQYFAKEREAVMKFAEKFDIYYSVVIVQLESLDILYPEILVIMENHSNKDSE
jgi:hypothetical protein